MLVLNCGYDISCEEFTTSNVNLFIEAMAGLTAQAQRYV